MEESVASTVPDGEIIGIKFGLSSHQEIRTSSISDCPISHASQLGNPFLGLPLEIGRCESCGTAEPGQCEGHFGYIELPIPVYHPSHVSELKRLLSLVCLKCLKMKSNKFPVKNNGVMEKLLSACCDEACHVSIKECKNNDGAIFLELRIPARARGQDDCWNFLERYGYRYGDGCARTLLPSEVLVMLRKLPEDTRKKLAKKGYFPQDGYILRYVPVPPNCLSVPDISDGVSVMSSDLCSAMLKKVLRQIEVIRSSRSGEPNFESHEVEANDLQVAVLQYLQVRGTGKAARDGDKRFGVSKDGNNSSKAWVEKMRTLFISKGSGFSSRSVITGDAYRPVNEVGVPCEIAQKMTFEERVNVHNIQYLQGLVDKNLCLTFKDGSSSYSLREGSKAHTFLRLGQVVHRRIMDGDIVFINRPPTTHKHSLQALRVYIHDDHVVKINPLMCGPLAADFDGDCVHLFYPQSLSARAEVLELFSVEKQLLSSHSGNLNLQLATDSLLSLKTMFKMYFLDRASAQQLAMYSSTHLPRPAVLKGSASCPKWTAQQVLQSALPSNFECLGDKLLIHDSEVLKLDYNRDVMGSIISDILTSLFFNKSPKDALDFFDSLQPLLMENLYSEGFSVGLNDFYFPKSDLQNIQSEIQDLSNLLLQLRSSFNELVHLQFDSHIRQLKEPVQNFIVKYSALGNLIDSRSDSAIDKVVQQIGFLGLQLSDKRKFYSKSLVEEVASLFHQKYPYANAYPSEEFGLVKSCFFHGLDPYEEIVHSIATREVIVRSSKGLAEPGTLFKNLMAVLRDVVICYDGTVRNISSNSIIQFEYGVGGLASQSLFPAGEPVGVLAATAMSNPAYKAVLDSSPNSNSSWDLMKEILFCRANFRNDVHDRRVILYLNDCSCGRKYCQENASCLVKNHLKKVSLRDAAVELSIEYKRPKLEPDSCETDTGLVGHIHLNAVLLKESGIDMNDILQKCEEQVSVLRRKKKFGYHFKRISLSVSKCCFFKHSDSKWTDMPCLKFFWQDLTESDLERIKHIMADMICPVLLDTIIKGDPRICSVNIIWISPGTTTWVESPCSNRKGELAVEVTLEKAAIRQSGDAWRIVLDCCLPVFHLIDTSRSIPYAIKQVQDLFGISCAFDQAVQRLSTSVTMVTKGVLKEHLLLLASSMTSAGNLVGFNTSGIKALCRALSVQVPFTEATLYTPRKCFERASEKCHVDTLASIVGSCSWGKRVSIGTGAKFDILWDTKEIEMADKPTDVYNFLHLMSSSTDLDVDTGCLGEDIDNFDEDVNMEPALSPEQESKAVFEDPIEIDVDSDIPGTGGSGWDAVPSSGKEWNANKTDAGSGSGESSGWAKWGSKKEEDSAKASSGWGESKPKEDSAAAGGWDASNSWGGSKPKGPATSAWGVSVNATDNSGSDWGSKPEEDSAKASNSWGASKPKEPSSGWGASKQKEDSAAAGDQDASNSWGGSKPKGPPTSAWGASVKATVNSGSDWGSKPEEDSAKASNSWGGSKPKELSSGWGTSKPKEDSTVAGGWDASKSWAKSKPKNPSSAWGSSVNETGNSGMSDKNESGANGWANNSDQAASSEGWNSAGKVNSVERRGDWSGGKGEERGVSSGLNSQTEGDERPWNISSGVGTKKTAWGKPDQKSDHESSGGWTSDKVNEQSGSESWKIKKDGNQQRSWGQSSGSTWGKSAGSWSSSQGMQRSSFQRSAPEREENKAPSSWGQPKGASWNNTNNESDNGWGSGKSNQQGGARSWDSNKKESNSQSSWAQDASTWKTGNEGAKDPTLGIKEGESSGWSEWKSKPEGSSKASKSWGGSNLGDKKDHGSGSGSAKDGGWASWGPKKHMSQPEEKSEAGGWDVSNTSKPKESSSAWGASVKESSSAWGASVKETDKPGWSNRDSKQDVSDSAESGGWGSKKNLQQPESSSEVDGWDVSKSWTRSTPKEPSSSWGKPVSENQNKNEGWNSTDSNAAGNESESQSPWGQPNGSGWKKKRPEGGRGWGSSNSGEWKSRLNRPPKQHGGPNDDSTGVAFTATRKRMDLFSSEEQDVLSEIESIMQSIRRVMHQSGCTDGEPLPSEDQTYVIDNVLNYHPDKAAKIGSGVDFITVKKHSNFQESRCFYVVSTDGQSTDFSYIKCLENFAKGKYPTVAESFTSKYFRKPRLGGNPAPNSPAPNSPAPNSPAPNSPAPNSPAPPSPSPAS